MEQSDLFEQKVRMYVAKSDYADGKVISGLAILAAVIMGSVSLGCFVREHHTYGIVSGTVAMGATLLGGISVKGTLEDRKTYRALYNKLVRERE